MEKPKIYATGNENLNGYYNVSYYVVEKDKNFFDWLGRLLVEVMEMGDGESGEGQAKFIFEDVKDEKGLVVDQNVYAKEIEKMIDVHEKYENKGNRLDIFYGKERIFLTFRKMREAREKMGDFMRKTKEWIKIKEKKQIPAYARSSTKTQNK